MSHCKCTYAESVKSPVFPKCHKANEMVSHYLILCKAFTTQREHMERELRKVAKSVSTLLMNLKAFLHLFRFIHDMRRFQRPIKDI